MVNQELLAVAKSELYRIFGVNLVGFEDEPMEGYVDAGVWGEKLHVRIFHHQDQRTAQLMLNQFLDEWHDANAEALGNVIFDVEIVG